MRMILTLGYLVRVLQQGVHLSSHFNEPVVLPVVQLLPLL